MNAATAGSTQNQRRGRAPQIVGFCDHVGDLVEGAADKVHELEFRYWAHAGESGTKGRSYDGGLGNGRIDDALGAKTVDETVSDFESAAVNTDVLTDAENGGSRSISSQIPWRMASR